MLWFAIIAINMIRTHASLENECGLQGTFNKILDGEYTAIDEFPWLARIGYKTQTSSEILYSCGGALISERVVLTAGHCMAYLASENQIMYNVVLGEYDTSTSRDCVEMMGYQDCADPVQNILVDFYILHPNYLGGYNDIGLVFLKEDAKFTDFVRPVCLPPSDTIIETDEKFIVSGWGKTESGNDSTVKLKATIPVRNFADCAQIYLKNKKIILDDEFHICAGSRGRDTCTGDSGLPMVSTKGDNTRWKVFGITSRGYGCGREDWPGVYTRVSPFVDWIEEVSKLYVHRSLGQTECIPVSQCRVITSLPRERLADQEIIAELRKAHCGYNNEALIKCNSLEEAIRRLSGTRETISGGCIPISTCTVALSLVNETNRNLQVISLLRQAHCGYKTEAQVNCTFLEQTVKDIRLSFGETCIPITQCPKGKKILMENTDLQQIISALGKAYCGLNGTTMTVKCSMLRDEGTIQLKLPNPDLRECGIQKGDNKIYSGTLADIDDFPWIALLYYENNPSVFGCHGTLISSRYVLTAAHCLDKRILDMYDAGNVSRVVLGEFDTRNVTDCVETYPDVYDCADPVKEYSVESVKVHPQFSPTDARNDIALIKLTEDVQYTEFVAPVCLPPKNYMRNENETFWVSGWGKTETVKRSPVKLKAKVPYVTKETCSEEWQREISDNVVCAGRDDGRDTCKGDSGGPLMYQRPAGDQLITYELGVVSYGRGLCGTGPAIYTYVPSYLDWIKENIV